MKSVFNAAALVLSLAMLIQQKESWKAPEHMKSVSIMQNLQIFDVTSAFVGNNAPAISSYAHGGNRVLAMKVEESMVNGSGYNEIFEKYGCLAFTNKNPHEGIKTSEIDYLNDRLVLKESTVALIGMDAPSDLEKAFEEFYVARHQHKHIVQ